jgi:hypothetical protein
MHKIEKIQADILSLYALLKTEQINDVFSQCCEYMTEITEVSFVKQILGEGQIVKMTAEEIYSNDPIG